MKKKIRIMVVILFFWWWFALLINVASAMVGEIMVDGYKWITDDSLEMKQEFQEEKDEVEQFFLERGYKIDIIGAYTNGREHEGPFLYGWYWHSFEIDEEVILLYPYRDMEEINGYLTEMDKETSAMCNISEHFLFYYSGNDQSIANIIKEFCERDNE